MSGNPNMQKIGKWKTPSGHKQPDWLFPSKETPTSTLESQNEGRLKNKKDKQLAKDLLKRRAVGEPPKSAAPPQLLKLVSAFLTEYEFTNTAQALETEREGRGETGEDSEDIPSLGAIYTEWCISKDQKKGLGANTSAVEVKPTKKQKSPKQKSETSSSESSSDDSDIEMADAPSPKKLNTYRSSSSSSSSSDSDADDEEDVPAKVQSPKPKVNALKRKTVSTSESSSGSDSSSDEEGPKAKKAKTELAATSSDSDPSSEEDSSDSESSSDEETPNDEKDKAAGSSSESETSSSDSDSDSDQSTNSIAQKIPLPDSDSESSSEPSSEPDSESSVEDAKKKPIVGSDTSATLSDGPKKMTPSDDSSSDSTSSSDSDAESNPAILNSKDTTSVKRKLSPPLPPDPVAKLSKKKANERFSRIPKNIKVDERLASNAYVPYDYAQKAHEDLIITKGKGFTKEKNKKKRGSYKGGYIDVEGKKGIKFDD